MLAAYATRFSPHDPLAALEVGDRPEPAARENWTTVEVHAASLNHHDLWSLRGVGLRAEQLPMILGTDAAGVTTDGREVVVHAVIGATGHGVGPAETRSLPSERYPGTLAERVAAPTWNLVPKPAELTFAEASCLPTAWLTAYRMLFTSGRARPGDRVLVQGASGGVSTAALLLGVTTGLEVYVTSQDTAKRARALELGAATWGHSVRSVRPGGTIVVAGATAGDASPAELQRIFFLELSVIGVTMGSKDDLVGLLNLLVRTGVRPIIDTQLPLARAAAGLARLEAGTQFGKIVLTT
ncbi:MAG TPA: zinc-binding dehydrogenase [Pengzhenrongella sp.]